MLQIKQKDNSSLQGGFSDHRLRFYILGFMTFGTVITPALGMVASFCITILFAIFTAVKIAEFQSKNPMSAILHNQAMDRMYHNSQKAEYYNRLIKEYNKLHKSQEKTKTEQQVNSSGLQNTKNINRNRLLRLSIATN